MTWDAYNRRKEVLREALAIADARVEVTTTELLDTVDQTRATFFNENALLFEVQMAWFQSLSGTMDRLVVEGIEDPETMAITAWVMTAGTMPGARALLDAHADEPALAKAFAKERAFLAASAGVSALHPDFTGHGRRIQDVARETAIDVPAPVVETDERRGLVSRLKDVLAA